jgi:hypothetical protein
MSLPVHSVFFFVLIDPKQRGPAIDPNKPVVLATVARHMKQKAIFAVLKRVSRADASRKVSESRKAYFREAIICMADQSNDQTEMMAIIPRKR